MAFSKFQAMGRVIKVGAPRFDTKKSCLEVIMNVPTGEQKKEGEEYAPSNLVKFFLWDKAADALSPYISQGSKLLVHGDLGVPNVYEGKATIIVNYANVQLLGDSEQQAGGKTESKTKTQTAKKETKKEEVEDNFDDDDMFD